MPPPIDFDQMIQDLGILVSAESPSSDLEACARCSEVLAAIGERVLGAPAEALRAGGRVHLRWQGEGKPRVALVGHFDTVWPLGTLADRPFEIRDGHAFGPGVFDMKAGIVQGLHALRAVGNLDGVQLLLTSDEEIGSPTSRGLIEDLARGVEAVLVLEPSAGGALKIARKGISMYRVRVTGRSAHAGLEPEKGINALTELARLVPVIEALASIEMGTTVTPTMLHAGIAGNVVPPEATLEVDVRALTVAEQHRVHAGMTTLVPVLLGALIAVSGGPDRPAMESTSSADLFRLATQLAPRAGIADLRGVTVGGGSDGNLTAAVGTATLDGLGAVGRGAHAPDERVVLAEMTARAELVRLLVADLLGAR
ncbi:MAG: M20/M25/M40 family metallo-hydrolase [Candidatus Dormibacteria bacterium]